MQQPPHPPHRPLPVVSSDDGGGGGGGRAQLHKGVCVGSDIGAAMERVSQ